MFNINQVDKITPLTEIFNFDLGSMDSYHQRVKQRHDYLLENLKQNPDFEAWDYMEYFPFKADKLKVFKEILISSKGRIIRSTGRSPGVPTKSTACGDKTTYVHSSVLVNKKKFVFSIHRVVGTVFVPGYDASTAPVINHKNLDKFENHHLNLEWVSFEYNSRHAILEQAYKNKPMTLIIDKIFKLRWMGDDENRGKIYLLCGKEDLLRSGITSTQLGQVLHRNKAKYCMGFEVSYGVEEDVLHYDPLPDFYCDKIKNDISYMDLRVVPLKGTIIETGEEFCIIGKTELISFGFSQGNVSVALVSGKPTIGVTWEKITRYEANLLQRGLTEKQKTFLNKYRRS